MTKILYILRTEYVIEYATEYATEYTISNRGQYSTPKKELE